MNRMLPLLAVLVVGLTVAPTPVAAAEDPRFETYVAEPTLAPGQSQQVTVQLVNDAEDVDDTVENATNVRAEMRSGSTPFDVTSGTKLLGTMPDGEPATATFSLEVPANVDPGTYRVPIDLDYEFEGDESESTTVYATLRIEDRAHFTVRSTTGAVPVGDSGSVTVTLENVGTRAAHNATVTSTSGSQSVQFKQGTATADFVERWEPGEERSVTVEVQTADTATPGTVPITTRVTYDDSGGNAKESFPMESGLTLSSAQSFAFESVESTLRVGEKGTVTAVVRNDGPRPVTDAVVQIGETGPSLSPRESEFGLGTLGVDESRTVRFPVDVAPTAEPSPRRLPFVVSYQNENGDLQRTDETYLSVDVAPDRDRFVLSPVRNTLRVGEEGTLEMDVTNNGEAVEDVVVRIQPPGQNVHPQETAYAVGEMGAEETRTVSFPIEVSDNAEAVPRQLSFQVNYEDADSDALETPPYNLRVDIGDRKDRFVVDPLSTSMETGTSDTIELSVTNNGDEPVENVEAKIFADDPLSAADDEAFIDSLDPGDSATITFSIGVSGGAVEKVYPLSMDFQYEEAGKTKLSRTYKVPVTVTESEGGNLPVLLGGLALLVVLVAGGYYLYSRR